MAVSFTPTVVTSPSGVQGSYPLVQTVGHEGQLADLRPYRASTGRNETGAPIAFGTLLAAVIGAGKDEFSVGPIATGSETPVGFALDAFTFEGSDATSYIGTATGPKPAVLADGRLGYPDLQAITLLTHGVAYGYVTEEVDLVDTVRIYRSNYSGTVSGAFQGRFCTTAVPGQTIVVSGARFASPTAAAGLVLIEFDITNMSLSAE